MVKPWSDGVKPPGQLAGVDPRLVAGEAETAEGLGFCPPATKLAAETTGAKPRLSRIQWNMQETVGWPEATAASRSAAAGARARRIRRYGEQGMRCLASMASAHANEAVGHASMTEGSPD